MGEVVADGELVRRIAGRASASVTREAEQELCRRFAARAELYGRKHLRDKERARDLAQAVMVAVLEAVRAGRVQEPELIVRFVLGVCRNTALRMREADARAQPTDTAELESLPASAPQLEALETFETGALFRCMSGLDARDRAVLFLSFNEERSADEIAARIDTTPGNVRVLRHRALAQLRRCLDDCREAAR